MNHSPSQSATPPPLWTSSTAFTRDTMSRRVPYILRAVSERNPDYAPETHQALLVLADALRTDQPLPPPTDQAGDRAAWEPLYAPYAGTTWLHTGWFFAEVYVYRLILDAVRFHDEPRANPRDPFAPAKQPELANPRLPDLLEAALAHRERPLHERLHALLSASLWSNRIDLSLATSAALGTSAADADLLCDDRAAVLDHLLGSAPGPVHLVADNAGPELAHDLVLIDALLDGAASHVALHLKHQPMFVSDATPHDLAHLLNHALAQMPGDAIPALRERLLMAGWHGRLSVTSWPIWNRPVFVRDFTAADRAPFEDARLVIFKGDLNYRRLSGDALWPFGTPFAALAGDFPAPVLALRTLKSETIAGVDSPPGPWPSDRSGETAGSAQTDGDASWLTSGRYGVIQFSGGGPTA